MTKDVLFLVDRPLGLRCLQFAVSQRVNIGGVISRPDGLGPWWGESKVQAFCRVKRLPWFDLAFELLPVLRKTKPAVIISVLSPRIVPQEVLNLIKCYNLHCAPLPDLKGFNSSFWAIFKHHSFFGCTIHEMVAKADAGPIVQQSRFPIPPGITNRELYALAHEDGYQLFQAALPQLVNGPRRTVPQKRAGRFYGRHEFPSRQVNPRWSLKKIDTYARAFYFPPFEPAYLMIQGRKVYLQPLTPTIKEVGGSTKDSKPVLG